MQAQRGLTNDERPHDLAAAQVAAEMAFAGGGLVGGLIDLDGHLGAVLLGGWREGELPARAALRPGGEPPATGDDGADAVAGKPQQVRNGVNLS